MNKPITNRVQKAVARGKVTQQPLLDVGEVSPLKKEKSTGNLILEGSTTAPDTTETVKGTTTTSVGDYSKKWDVEAAGGLSYAEWIKKPGNKAKEDAFVDSKTETVTTIKR